MVLYVANAKKLPFPYVFFLFIFPLLIVLFSIWSQCILY
jgi:hypothetical protein